MLTVLLQKYRQSWAKEEQAISHPFLEELRNLIIWWKTLISGQLMAISFTERSLPPTKNSRQYFWPILIYHFWIESTVFMLMLLLKQFQSISTSYWLFIVLFCFISSWLVRHVFYMMRAQLIFQVSSVFAWEFRRILVDSSVSDLILVIWTYFGQFWTFRFHYRNLG